MKDERVYLIHILECIAKIEEYTEGGRQVFVEHSLVQDGVMRNLEVIGEAASNVSLDFRQRHRNVSWRRAINLRNVLIHNYMGVSIEAVWNDVVVFTPSLKVQVSSLLDQLDKDAEPNS
jgi:uncharacterized protein with HEPN domain